MMSRMTAEPKYPDRQMPPTSIAELVQWADQNNKPYHKFFAQWAQKHRFTNVNDALVWVGDNVDPYDEFGPTDHENDFGELVGEPLVDAAKHNPKAAELLKVFKCYEEIIDDWDDDYRQMNMAEKLGDNRPKLGSKRDAGKSIRKWRKSRGLDETGVAEGLAQDPSQPYLDKLGARAGAAPGSNITQVTDAYQQKLLDRMGARFGLPPGSTMDQVQAAQQAHLDKNDPAAAAQYKQNMTNIDAGNTAANKPVQLAPKAPDADFAGFLLCRWHCNTLAMTKAARCSLSSKMPS
jgi:hypothetical protein